MFDAPVKSLHYGEKMPLLKNLCGFAALREKKPRESRATILGYNQILP